MSLSEILSYGAAAVAAALAGAIFLRERRSVATWLFCAGMLLFAVEAAVAGMVLKATDPEMVLSRCRSIFALKSLSTPVWLAFSLVYARGNYREFVYRWRWMLPLLVAVLLVLGFGMGAQLLVWSMPDEDGRRWIEIGRFGQILSLILLCSLVLALANLERTFHQTTGTLRWRFKFVLVGLGLAFGARIFTRSQSLLFSSVDPSWLDLESGALLIGCVLIVVAQARHGLSGVEVYPSYAFLEKSVTVLLVGGYLLLVGLLAQVTRWIGGAKSFQAQALLILVAIAALGIALLSERFRQRVRYFVSRHFERSQHDFRKVWTELTGKLTKVRSTPEFSATAASTFSETFNALSVRIWLLDEDSDVLSLASSTETAPDAEEARSARLEPAAISELGCTAGALDLEDVRASWGDTVRALNRSQFREHDNRIVLPLQAGGRVLGLVVLADRVYRMPYTPEELDLARCMADQMAGALLNLRLGHDLLTAKEFETFQTMSAFFVHDLKNSASGLNLMLKNLPLHFDNPEFREDALRGLGKATGRINDLIARLGEMRRTLELNLGRVDLNGLIRDTVAQFKGDSDLLIDQQLQLVQPVVADEEQIRSVVSNLVLNASEALNGGGRISISTERRDGRAVLTVSDNGCGMTPEFLAKSLFRPFQTTKKKGIGIGMFQTRMIVEAHQGRIQVESTPGEGTTFRVMLPLHSTIS